MSFPGEEGFRHALWLLLWQLPDMGQPLQPAPQLCFPAFLSLIILLAMKKTMTARTAATISVDTILVSPFILSILSG